MKMIIIFICTVNTKFQWGKLCQYFPYLPMCINFKGAKFDLVADDYELYHNSTVAVLLILWLYLHTQMCLKFNNLCNE